MFIGIGVLLLALLVGLTASYLRVPLLGQLAGGHNGFAVKVEYPAENGPIYLAAGNFVGDSKRDIAVSNAGTCNCISVFRNNGNGTFAARVDHAIGVRPLSIIISDLNTDGKGDIAIVQANGKLAVLMNNGNGSFDPKVEYVGVQGSLVASGLQSGDLNDDGKPDLAAVFASTSVAVFLNNGDGTFAPKADYATAGGTNSLTMGDLNADGKLDLATANNSQNSISVLLNNSNGTFAAKVDYPTGISPVRIATGDFNGDGDSDLATLGNLTNTVSVLLNNGNGTFGAKADYATGIEARDITASDINGDGMLDILTANTLANEGNLTVLFGDASGTFSQKQGYGSGIRSRGVASEDLNGDGLADVALTGYSITNNVYANNNLAILMNIGFCGDGFRRSTEQCDDGNEVDNDTCRNSCLNARCGDFLVQPSLGEECDDPPSSGTNEIQRITYNGTIPINWIVNFNGVQTAPIPPDSSADVVKSRLEALSTIGAGNVTVSKAFNIQSELHWYDVAFVGVRGGINQPQMVQVQGPVTPTTLTNGGGGGVPSTTCNTNCKLFKCGDGIRTGTEQCDDGNQTNTDACTNACRNARCGDGFLQGTEQCDDGNTINTDACTNQCRFPTSSSSSLSSVSSSRSSSVASSASSLSTSRSSSATSQSSSVASNASSSVGLTPPPPPPNSSSAAALRSSSSRSLFLFPLPSSSVQSAILLAQASSSRRSSVAAILPASASAASFASKALATIPASSTPSTLLTVASSDSPEIIAFEPPPPVSEQPGGATPSRGTSFSEPIIVAVPPSEIPSQPSTQENADQVLGLFVDLGVERTAAPPVTSAPTPTQVCGDGYKEGSESCDDGNTDPGDGCGETCRKEGAAGTAAPDSTGQYADALPFGQTPLYDLAGDVVSGRRGSVLSRPTSYPPQTTDSGPAAVAVMAGGAAAGFSWMRRRRKNNAS